MMTEVLNFFKQKNPGWTSTKTFIIDNDLVEWRVLKKCFPDATILLFQFHARKGLECASTI